MRRFRFAGYLYSVLGVAIWAMLCFSACNWHGSESTPSPSAEATPTPANNSLYTSMAADSLSKQEEIMIYTLTPENYDINAVYVVVHSTAKITPQFIVSQVVVNLSDANIDVGVNSVTTDADTIFVDFSEDTAPVVIADANLENSVLSVIGQSLIDNLPEYSKVVYKVNGGAYMSENYKFEEDYVYIER